MNTKIGIKGKIKIDHYVKGILVETIEQDNLITTNGLAYIAKFFAGTYTIINKIGLGDSNIPEDASDSALKNRKILLDFTGRDNTSPGEIQFLTTVPPGSFASTVNFKEAGLIFKSTTEEILVTRVVFSQVVYQPTDDSLSIAYSMQFFNKVV
jgi:hypothetical protein